MPLLGVRTLVLLSREDRELTPQPVPVLESLARQLAGRDCLANSTPRLLGLHAFPETTARGVRLDTGERGTQAIIGVPQLQLSHPGRIDEQRAVGEPHELAMRGRVAPLSCRRERRCSLL